MPPHEVDELKKRVGRKLVRRLKAPTTHITLEMPESLKYGDDVDEDVTRPKGQKNMTMNQSIFGMIAAAGSQVDCNTRFETSQDDDANYERDMISDLMTGIESASTNNNTSTAPTPLGYERAPSPGKQHSSLQASRLRLLSLNPSPKQDSQITMSDSDTTIAPKIKLESLNTSQILSRRPQPIMSQMLEARAELSQRPSCEQLRSMDGAHGEAAKIPDVASDLATRLKDMFAFKESEDVISEYQCWLMKSVLLQGFMYITTKHVCFYAYLPKNSGEVAKSGYLSKRGQKNPKYNRYWFRLKGDVLSYYTDPAELYFPYGHVDLRYGITATVDEERNKDGKYFTVVTDQKTIHFRADSAASAKDWVKSLQKIIFRSHNSGESVKISLPISNILDVEETQVIDFAKTCKIRYMENDESYAIDEYFFTFFSGGIEALELLKLLVEKNAARELAIQQDLLDQYDPKFLPKAGHGLRRNSLRPQSFPASNPVTGLGLTLEDQARTTLSPTSPLLSPTLVSGDFAPLSSSPEDRQSVDYMLSDAKKKAMESDRGRQSDINTSERRSSSICRASSDKKASEGRDSSDSFARASIDAQDSSLAIMTESQNSASQILSGSDVLFKPTIATHDEGDIEAHSQRPHPAPIRKDAVPYSNMLKAEVSASASEASHATLPSTPTLQGIVKSGIMPLQRAAGAFNFLNNNSRRMGSFLATESMGYVEKVSGMWKGGKKHYDGQPGAMMDDDDQTHIDQDPNTADPTSDRFREHFGLPLTETLQATYFGYFFRVIPLYGKIYISDRSFCFRSMLPGTRTKIILPLSDIENAHKENAFRFGFSGLVVVVKGHSEIFFEFTAAELRDDCTVTLIQGLEHIRYLRDAGLLEAEEQLQKEAAVVELEALEKARIDSRETPSSTSAAHVRTTSDSSPVRFDDNRASFLSFKPMASLRVTCLTIGSRGDVQPYIALAKGLQAEGHTVKIATHDEFRPWVESHGIGFAAIGGDPAELMRICVEHGMFTYSFLKEANAKFRGWLDDLLASAWRACQDTDLLIESPSAMCGIHIAEALAVPYFRAFTMPWTRTRAYPHAFAMPEHRMGGAYNYLTYVMFDTVFWKAIAGQINHWRAEMLGLGRTNLEKMQPNKVPFLYNFSPSVVAPPLDYSDWIRVTGYWFLDEGSAYSPPDELTAFIARARADNKKLVYIGFGSIVVADSRALTESVVASVERADVRCILSKGWSDRLDKTNITKPDVIMPDSIYQIKSVPHDWLFGQVDAAVHHGGAGTTGASLRAGLPTIIKPFFGDQFFYGLRVEDLGVGICLRRINVTVLARALWEVTHSIRIITKAQAIGRAIRAENGVDSAIQAIYRDLDYARSLIKRKDGADAGPVDEVEDIEESWTFIGDENANPEIVKRVKEVSGWGGTEKPRRQSEDGGVEQDDVVAVTQPEAIPSI